MSPLLRTPSAATALALALALVLLLGGCASVPAPTPRGAPVQAPAGAPPSAPAPTLEAEQRRVAAALRATPAVVALDDDGALWVDLPVAGAFAPGSSAPQPALRTALTELAPALRRLPDARVSLRLPGEGSVVLADRRAAQVRVLLSQQGVATTRVHAGRAAPPGRALVGVVPAASLTPLPAPRPAP